MSLDITERVGGRFWVIQQLTGLQRSYSEGFSIHGLTRIIYSGWKERLLWLVLFLAAVAGLGYMSSEIIKRFHNNDIRTEVRIEQRESLGWPTITVCSQASLIKQNLCHNGKAVKHDLGSFPPELCSKQLKQLFAKEYYHKQRFDYKKGCIVYNLDGTLLHKGGLRRGLDIYYSDPNADQDWPDFLKGAAVFINDPSIAKNSSHSFHIQDIDLLFGALSPGAYEISLETTEIEKLGLPYRSSCTKRKLLDDRYHSAYSYGGCLDTCMAVKLQKKCGNVGGVLGDYVTNVPRKIPENENETIECFSESIVDTLRDNNFFDDCGCLQPCKQKIYRVTQKQLTKDINGTHQSDNHDWLFKIRFKNNMVNVIKEYPLYSTQDLISQVGGSSGLFLGVSILSVMEILIYAVISLIKHCI